MKKNVIAILLSLVVAVSSVGPVPVIAAETAAAETAAAETATNAAEATAAAESTAEEAAAEEGDDAETVGGEQADESRPSEDVSEETGGTDENAPGDLNEGENGDVQDEDTQDSEGEGTWNEDVQDGDADSTGEGAWDEDTQDEDAQDDSSADSDTSEQADEFPDEIPEAEITETLTDEAGLAEAAAGTANAAAEAQVIGLAVDAHSQDEIRSFIRNNPGPLIPNTYAEDPSVKVPYSPGELSDRTTEAAFNALNQMRYVAGIPADVAYDAGYTEQAQAAALVNAINGTLSHYPERPEGISDDLYELAYSGASSSNIAAGTGSLASSVRLWMSDSDSSNIDRVGHRRWMLNPTMKKAGFGAVGRFSAIYAHDGSFVSTTYSRVAWPAQNMPLEFWNNGDAWSVSFGKSVPMANVVVTLTRKGDGKVWTFSSSSADGYFNVENSNYGRPGCVIFRPDNISYSSGDQFDVRITSADTADVAYTVNFFALCGGDHSYTTEKFSEPTCAERGVTLKICEDCGYVKYEYEAALGHKYQVLQENNGLYTMKCDVCGDETTAVVPTSIYPYWRKEGAGGYYWSAVPSGLEAGDGLEYMIDIESYSASGERQLNDIMLESDDPEHCIIKRSGETTGTIRFTEAGDYRITIYPTYNPDCKLIKQVKIVKPIEAVTILTEPGHPLPYGSSIGLAAQVDGGKGTLKYKFVAVGEDGTETTVRSEATGATCTWKPAAAGTYGLRVDVKDTGDNDRVVSSSVLSYTVEKQPVKVKDNKRITANGALTYGQKLSGLQVNNASFAGGLDGKALTGTFAFEEPDKVLPAGKHEAGWSFTPDDDNYEKISGSLSMEVIKAVPELYSGPTWIQTTYHPELTLADAVVTDGTVRDNTPGSVYQGSELKGSWEWAAPDTSLQAPGDTHVCRFVPEDEDNYESVETTVDVSVAKAVPFITDITAQEITYGQTLADSSLTGSAQYSEDDKTAVNGTFTSEDSTIAPAVSDSGKTSYKVIFTPSDLRNYEKAVGKTTLTVKKAKAPAEMPPTAISVPYSTDKLSDEILRNSGIKNWSFVKSSIGKALTAGRTATFTANYTGSDKGNYETESVRIKVTRSSCDHNGTVTVKNAADPTCTKEGQTGDKYCDLCGELLESSVAIPVLDHTWDEGKITKEPQLGAEGVKTYTCTACGTTRTEAVPALIDIAGTSIGDLATKTYSGKEITQTVVVKDGDQTLVLGTDYTVSYKNNIDPGTASVVIAGIGRYAGEAVKEFTILPGKTKRGDMFNLANNVKVTWYAVPGARYYKVYRIGVTDPGESRDEPVIVTTGLVGWDKDPGLTNGHAYRYRIVASLTGRGDPSGDSPLSYSKLMYRLKTVVIRSVKNTAPGKVTVKYDKTVSGDSYVLQYCEREDMVGAKTKVVLGAQNTSYVIGGLKKGKTYYISIRVRKKVDGIDYYTTFGVAKKITITK